MQLLSETNILIFLIQLFVLMLCTRGLGELFTRWNQPALTAEILVGILLGRGLNIDQAKAELKGVTLESLVVAVRVARAVKACCAAGKLNAADFPLLLHTDEILTEKKPVDIPWEAFTFEKI